MHRIPVTVPPMDELNKNLISNVHPSDWTNPNPAPIYNLVVIGGGTAGLVAAAGAAGLGAKVALIEKHLLGGDCLNFGCVPSKTMIRSSRIAADIASAGAFGIRVSGMEIDFSAVMERMRRIRTKISHHDSAKRFKSLGVDVFLGAAHFIGPHAIEVDDKVLKFRKALIATGARAAVPPVPGLAEAGFLTNETVFTLTERPRRLAVIGGGPIGCELAQAFRRLGCEVALFHNGPHILNREDPDAAEIVQKAFIREGIRLVLNSNVTKVELNGKEKTIYYEAAGGSGSVTADEIIAAAGRTPNVEGLNLEAAGVKYDAREGVIVNDNLQTANPNVFASGDICMKWKFTHAADAASRIVIQNALFFGRKKLSSLTMPWCTYTDPEIAHVGMYEADAKSTKEMEIVTFLRKFEDVDRAIADGEEEGFVKIHIIKGSDHIVGATVVGSHAGDMISEISVAMAGDVGLSQLAAVIHPYPTQAEAIKQVADAYNRSRLTPAIKNVFSQFLSWTR